MAIAAHKPPPPHCIYSMFCTKESFAQLRIVPCTPLAEVTVPCLCSHPLFEGPQVLTLNTPRFTHHLAPSTLTLQPRRSPFILHARSSSNLGAHPPPFDTTPHTQTSRSSSSPRSTPDTGGSLQSERTQGFAADPVTEGRSVCLSWAPSKPEGPKGGSG
jgi:hypothetical protein